MSILRPIALSFLVMAAASAGCKSHSVIVDPPNTIDSLYHKDTSTYCGPRQCGTITDERATETSGLARSHRDNGILWIHNDSGDEPRIFAIDTTGATRATVKLDGAVAVDYEDIASAVISGVPYIYIGDIGDNDQVRDSITIYRITEPEVPSGGNITLHAAAEANSFTYSDGAHNCEALMVHPTTGDIYLITKTKDVECTVYRGTWRTGAAGTQTLEPVAHLMMPFTVGSLRLVTAADIHPDGTRLIVRTYLASLEYRLPAGEPFSSIWTRTPALIDMPVLTQAEAICYSRDGKRLYTTTEGTTPPLYVIEMKNR